MLDVPVDRAAVAHRNGICDNRCSRAVCQYQFLILYLLRFVSLGQLPLSVDDLAFFVLVFFVIILVCRDGRVAPTESGVSIHINVLLEL